MTKRSLFRKRALQYAALVSLLLAAGLQAKKFYDDDPLLKVPPPMNADKVAVRRISDYYDFFSHTLAKRGEQNTSRKFTPARGVNTLGEVPDGAWYTNRHYWNRMSIEELLRGPGDENAPDTSGPLTVVKPKTEGITPGFDVTDAKGRRYNVKFDPLTNPEMASAADVIVAKFLHALGYNVPENYLMTFARQQLVIAPGVTVPDAQGKRHPMTDRDVTELMLKVARGGDGRYRALASYYIQGKHVGEFRYHGTRTDDPNDIVPHEHRRDLRGLGVFCAWLGHDDSRAINTGDFLVKGNGVDLIKHYLIDFGSTLGSASDGPNSPHSGQYLFAWGPAAGQFLSLGLYVPRWARARYPKFPAVGRFEYATFDPETWVPEYRNPAFANRLPDDAFWAAKQVMAFTDEEIRALVKTGQYSDQRAEDWLVRCLIERRNKIGRAFFTKVLPLDRFAVRDGKLAFQDLAVRHGLIASRQYTVQWSRFNNDTEQKTSLPGETTLALPGELRSASAGEYFAADITSGDPKKTVTVYLRRKPDRVEVVGIDRGW
ncbi:MAG: hypothetical protein HYS33_03760 [Acidobacteria bacterium]|nr:hypothetical protein [Acidobacteriota bacterium]